MLVEAPQDDNEHLHRRSPGTSTSRVHTPSTSIPTQLVHGLYSPTSPSSLTLHRRPVATTTSFNLTASAIVAASACLEPSAAETPTTPTSRPIRMRHSDPIYSPTRSPSKHSGVHELPLPGTPPTVPLLAQIGGVPVAPPQPPQRSPTTRLSTASSSPNKQKPFSGNFDKDFKVNSALLFKQFYKLQSMCFREGETKILITHFLSGSLGVFLLTLNSLDDC